MKPQPIEKEDFDCWCQADSYSENPYITRCENCEGIKEKIRAALEWYKKYSGNLSLFQFDYPDLYDQWIRIVEMEARNKLGSTSVQYLLDEFLLKQTFRGVYDND